jgi:hypothetical protein
MLYGYKFRIFVFNYKRNLFKMQCIEKILSYWHSYKNLNISKYILNRSMYRLLIK